MNYEKIFKILVPLGNHTLELNKGIDFDWIRSDKDITGLDDLTLELNNEAVMFIHHNTGVIFIFERRS